MAASPYRIGTMSRAEVAIAIEWAAAEGWNPGLHDAECFHAADPGGFLVGRLDDEPVATISVVKYGASFAFLGLYIVKPAYRGHGYGIRIWEAGLARLAGRKVGLDGVVAQQDNYRKAGFTFAYRNVRYRGTGGATAPPDARIVPLSKIPVAETIAYDRARDRRHRRRVRLAVRRGRIPGRGRTARRDGGRGARRLGLLTGRR
jgi:ribosomal protein S18 acetylase RimI-like enzyme